jgi:hypothetical protein
VVNIRGHCLVVVGGGGGVTCDVEAIPLRCGSHISCT